MVYHEVEVEGVGCTPLLAVCVCVCVRTRRGAELWCISLSPRLGATWPAHLMKAAFSAAACERARCVQRCQLTLTEEEEEEEEDAQKKKKPNDCCWTNKTLQELAIFLTPYNDNNNQLLSLTWSHRNVTHDTFQPPAYSGAEGLGPRFITTRRQRCSGTLVF